MALTTLQAVRALVIGAGPAADHMHLPALARMRDHGQLELAIVCDIQKERAAAACRKFGFREDSTDAARALAREDVNAVYVFGSAQMHYEYGLAALRSGKHLFVEKPIAPSYAQALELAQTARARGLIAVAGHNRRFYKALAAVRAAAGRTRWRHAEAVFHKAERGKAVPYGARTWLTANGIHALDALVYMMGGLPEHLTMLVGEPGVRQTHVFSALMRWSDGAEGVFLCNNDSGSRREEYVFHGPGETCTVNGAGLTIEKAGKAHDLRMPTIGDGIAAEHEAFLSAVRGGHAPAHAIEAVAPSLFLAELIEMGFSGRIQPPVAHPLAAMAPAAQEDSVLIVRPQGMQAALARHLPNRRFVSLDEVSESTGPRADITAAVLGQGSAPLSLEVLAKLPRLKVVGVVGLSLARYAPEELLARNVTLLNASAAYAQSVAEFALALATLGRRRAFLSHEIMRRGGWGTDRRAFGFAAFMRGAVERVRPLFKAAGLEPVLLRSLRAVRPAVERRGAGAAPARELRGATVGLIGWGANAQAFTERLLQAGSQVLVYSEHAAESDIRKTTAVPASLAEVLAADIVSLHRGLTRGTRHHLGAAELEKLRPGTVLINVARGALIEPGALFARLKRGDIFACLDTYEEEPPGSSDPLRTLPNVFLTSHIAGGSADMHAAAVDEVLRKVAGYLQGEATEAVTGQRLLTMT